MARHVARLSDVARSAGVSVATISRYLNNNLQLPKPTADRVRAAIDGHDYQPNPHARSLSRGKSDTLGLVVPVITNPYFARRAVDLPVRGLMGEDVDDVVEHLPVELVLRESVRRPAKDDRKGRAAQLPTQEKAAP